MSKILEGLYIGSFADAKSKKFIKENNISHILICAWELKPAFPNSISYYKVEASDKVTFDIKKFFDNAGDFIHDTLSNNGNVLVH